MQKGRWGAFGFMIVMFGMLFLTLYGVGNEAQRIDPPCVPGSLDPSFNGSGFVTTTFPIGYAYARSVAVQLDGAIITAGSAYVGPGDLDYDYALVRYKSDGTLDDSFGIGGKVTTTISQNDIAFSVAIQQDGRIVVSGNSVVRYDPNGTLDPTFGIGGKASLPFSGVAYSSAIQPDGRIVVAGISQETQNDFGFAVARFNTDGTPDLSFGTGGWVTTRIRNRNGNAYSVAIQPDGRIVVVGQTIGSLTGFQKWFAVVRYNTNGTPDTSFGVNGVVTTQIGNRNDEAYSVAIQADGRIIAAGYSDYGAISNAEFALVRYNANGTLDMSFGSNGIVLTEFGNSDYILSVLPQADGKLVAAGRSGFRVAVARYNGDGTLDNSFNGTGQVVTSINGYPDVGAFSAALQQDRKIVAAGFASTGPVTSDFVVVRYGLDCTTITPSPTATPLVGTISGTITYGNALGAPMPRFVSNVLLSGAGSVAVLGVSGFPNGTYSLSGFGSGAYTVTPSKTGGVNGITSFDAGRIAQHVAGINPLTGNQLVVADVSGNGTISSFDAGQIAKYAAGLSGFGSAGNWIFTPANRNYASVTGNIAGEDFAALLMGEVSGNWANTGAR